MTSVSKWESESVYGLKRELIKMLKVFTLKGNHL
jgi:hypothetical protein